MNDLPNDASVSVVMLTHNDLESTRVCLASLCAVLQDPIFEELIILDNGSTDGTLDHVLGLSRVNKIRVISSDRNLGVALGRQRLFAEARGAIVASLDSDVTVRGTRYFEQARTLLSEHQDIAICGASGYRVHFSDGQLGLIPDNRNRDVDCVSGFCQIFPRHILQAVSIDPAFSPFWCEDTDFCFQAKALGLRIRQLDPESSLKHRYRSIDKRANDPRKARHEAMLVRKWEGRVTVLGEPVMEPPQPTLYQRFASLLPQPIRSLLQSRKARSG